MAVLIGMTGWSLRTGSRFISNFPAAEISSSFNRPLDRRIVERWLDVVQPQLDFRFTAVLGRQFTHERLMADSAVAFFKEGLWPLVRERRLGAILMRFPAEFRFGSSNRDYLLEIRRAFHEFSLVAEFSHESWMVEEGRGFLIDHKIGTVGTDLTSRKGYLRITEKQPNFARIEKSVRKLALFAEETFVIFDSEAAAIEMQSRVGSLTILPAQARLNFGKAVA